MYPWREQSVQQLFLLQVEAELAFEFPILHIEILWAMNIIKTVLGRHGSASLCRVERENKMAATYNVLAFKR